MYIIISEAFFDLYGHRSKIEVYTASPFLSLLHIVLVSTANILNNNTFQFVKTGLSRSLNDLQA